ncbi:hypothetical protein, partial [Stutzerimonas xanthomarina]|uniref:hypothetical protein n=1 Tax=Stutzerimonas xanthomarina TaxID=271420 RepID=UPI0029A2FAEB
DRGKPSALWHRDASWWLLLEIQECSIVQFIGRFKDGLYGAVTLIGDLQIVAPWTAQPQG